MRGKVVVFLTCVVTVRITPAYAGKSCCFHFQWFASWDHPRLCGEKSSVRDFPIKGRGSPPPMRGKEIMLWNLLIYLRITPAYAGKRFYKYKQHCLDKDHPRLCGEKYIALLFQNLLRGSPPPMRGKVGYRRGVFSSGRITPAYAGKSGSH